MRQGTPTKVVQIVWRGGVTQYHFKIERVYHFFLTGLSCDSWDNKSEVETLLNRWYDRVYQDANEVAKFAGINNLPKSLHGEFTQVTTLHRAKSRSDTAKCEANFAVDSGNVFQSLHVSYEL